MTDPVKCLRGATIGIALWNILYCLLQFGLLGWQLGYVKDLMAWWENRQLPATGYADGFQARFPGLYQIYTETPERRRVNAMYVIVIVCLILALAHLITSFSLLYGAVKYRKMYIWPWFFTAGPIICMTTAYAVLWWSGDIFNEQLTFSVAEFVMSCCINGICLVIVLFFYCRLSGVLTSNVPRHSQRKRRKRKRHHTEQLFIMPSPLPLTEKPISVPVQQPYTYYGVPAPTPAPLLVEVEDRYKEKPPTHLPAWRTEWPDIPDAQLRAKIRRHHRKEYGPKIEPARNDGSLDFFAPEPYEGDFPWKMKKLGDRYKRQKETPADAIAKMYYEHWPEELPDLPKSMRMGLRQQREATEDQMRREGLQKTTNIIS